MDEQLQQKIEMYRMLEAKVSGLMKQKEMVVNKMLEVKTTVSSLDEMEKSNGEILFPLGGEAWSTAKVFDKGSVVVEVGAGVALEKTFPEAKEILNKRVNELEKAMEEINKEYNESSEILNRLGPEIEKELSKG
ncbi:prefoldin subunit alpha [archaeon]|nr:MAG: prefoldin subunit alpha [archaeon]